MANLYELTTAFKDAEYYFNNAETEQEMLEAERYLIAAEVVLAEKAENIAKLIKNIEADRDGFKKEADRLSSKAKTLDNKITNLKRYLQDSLELAGVDNVKGEVLTVAIQNSQRSLEVNSISNIPRSFLVQPEPVVSKKELLKHILNTGEHFEGVEVVQGKHLRIR